MVWVLGLVGLDGYRVPLCTVLRKQRKCSVEVDGFWYDGMSVDGGDFREQERTGEAGFIAYT